ncbi:sulfate/molybdate ABC transporter ATP-binding protein [Glaciibacter flavus]|nr:ATP-binding cassette domain-containing protein [Glaciibacter flavus]
MATGCDPMSALAASLRAVRGSFTLDAALNVRDGEVLALLGPNGAGKSTVLALLAGLRAPELGYVQVGDRTLTRIRPGERSIVVPPEKRGIGLLGQDPRLFPHLDVAANVAFGPRSQGASAVQAADTAREWLERVGLADAGGRMPAQLSGGQQQRAAIARALAARPEVLLLDEPLASLDVQTAPAIRELLRTTLREAGTTAVIVTHDVLDAIVLAGRTAVLESGRIAQEGTTAQLLSAPTTPFTARIAGVNLVIGVGDRGRVRVADVLFSAPADATPILDGGPSAAVFRPSSVIVSLTRAEGSSVRNQWQAVIEALEPTESGIRVRTGPIPVAADVTPATVAELSLAVGSPVWLAVKAAEVAIHPTA